VFDLVGLEGGGVLDFLDGDEVGGVGGAGWVGSCYGVCDFGGVGWGEGGGGGEEGGAAFF